LHLLNSSRNFQATLANARPIDLSIQFTMFWMPFIVILGWWIGRPMSLLFGENCCNCKSDLTDILP
jgi:Ca2+:H+ antiporter